LDRFHRDSPPPDAPLHPDGAARVTCGPNQRLLSRVVVRRIRETRERVNRRFTGSFLQGRIFADLSDDLAANSID
jgi:hypothetical protein